MKNHAFVALALMCGLISCRAELPGTEAIVIPEKGLLEKDHSALRMRWAEKHLLPEAEKRWVGKSWAEQARSVTQKGLKLWFNGPSEGSKDSEKTTAAARELVKTDCDEPLACLMAHKILWNLRQDWWGGYGGLSKAFEIADNVSFAGALRVWIIDEQIDRLKSIHWRWDNFHVEQVDRMVKALSDGSYGAEKGLIFGYPVDEDQCWVRLKYITTRPNLNQLTLPIVCVVLRRQKVYLMCDLK